VRKLFISADMEGSGAVSSMHALLPDRWEWPQARRWMTDEVVVAAEAALAAGYGEVIVADSHGNAHNIDPDALPDNVQLIRSWPRPLFMMQGVADEGVDACMLLGHHAGSTTSGSVLAHSFNGAACRAVRLNGEACSEGFLGAALAGELGRPVIFVSGDEHTVADARRYAPEAVCLVTKQSLGYRSQMSLPPPQVRRRLKEAVCNALARRRAKPFLIRGPLALELEMTSQLAAEMLAYLPGVTRRDAWTVGLTFDSMQEAMRFISFAMFYSPTGAIAY
jgi:D-amino peptidase